MLFEPTFKISGGEIGVMTDYFIGEPLVLLYDNAGNNLFASLYLPYLYETIPKL